MALTFKKGKFYRDGIPEPLEFGNKDQIRIIENVKQLQEEGAVPTLVFDEAKTFICGLDLQCVCGSHVSIHWEKQDGGYEVEGTKLKCPGCDFKYEVCSDDDNFLFFKLVM